MTGDSMYGSRPDVLPRALVQLTRTEGNGARWVGRDGVELLAREAHLALEREAFGSLPRESNGMIKWGEVEEGLLIDSAAADHHTLSLMLQRLAAHEDSLVFMWSSLVVPTVRVPFAIALGALEALVRVSPESWILCESAGLLIEFSYFADRVVVAHIVNWTSPSRAPGKGDGG